MRLRLQVALVVGCFALMAIVSFTGLAVAPGSILAYTYKGGHSQLGASNNPSGVFTSGHNTEIAMEAFIEGEGWGSPQFSEVGEAEAKDGWIFDMTVTKNPAPNSEWKINWLTGISGTIRTLDYDVPDPDTWYYVWARTQAGRYCSQLPEAARMLTDPNEVTLQPETEGVESCVSWSPACQRLPTQI